VSVQLTRAPGRPEVVYMVREVVGHGGDKARLGSPRWPVEQVPTLPCLGDPHLVLPPPDEEIEIGFDGFLLRGVHGEHV
jgi:hypothetical protein